MMNWMKGLRARVGARLIGLSEEQAKQAQAVTLLSGNEGVPLQKFGDFGAYLSAVTGKVWASWKACDLVADKVSTTPFQIMRNDRQVDNPPADLASLLRYSNRYQTFAELLYLTTMHVKAVGNAFWFKSEPRANWTRPKEIIPLNPKRMKIVPGKEERLAGYIYQVGGKEIPLEVSEVLHFKRPHPDNDYWGLGDIEAGVALFNDWVNRDSFQENFWKNGARPSGVMSSEAQTLGDATALQKLKAQWEANYGGKKNAGKTAWIYGTWKYTQLGMSLKEMEAVETRKQNAKEIFMQHGVPLSVAGIEGAANYATAEIDRVRFNENTVLPMVRLIEDTVNTDLVSDWGLKLDFQVAGLTAVGEVVANYVPLFDRGAMSINEIRELVGLQPDPDNPLWSQHFMQAGLLPLDLAGIETGATEAAANGIMQRNLENMLKNGLTNDARKLQPATAVQG